jgi:uncharacterized protein (DUF983 family)
MTRRTPEPHRESVPVTCTTCGAVFDAYLVAHRPRCTACRLDAEAQGAREPLGPWRRRRDGMDAT